MADFFQSVFRFDKVSSSGWIGIALLVLFGIGLLIASRRTTWNARKLSTGALCIALAFVLSYVRLWKMPQGGSVTAGSMLPIILFAFTYGGVPGVMCGLVYGALQFVQSPVVVHPMQVLLDYFAAFGAIGVGAFLRGKGLPETLELPAAALVGGLARALFHVIAGAIFFAEYAGDQNPWVYSSVYNLTSVGLDTLICVAIAALPATRRISDVFIKRAA